MSNQNEKWYTAKEICELCGVSKMSFARFISNTDVTRDSKVVNTGKNHNIKTAVYTENVLKQFQSWLMNNQATQGNGSEITKQAVQEAVVKDLVMTEIISSGNTEAFEQLVEHYRNEMIQTQKVKQLEAENKQLNHALEYDKVSDWKPWNHLKKAIKYKGNFDSLVENIPLIRGEDFEKKTMGFDNYKTILVSPSGEEKIIDYKENVIDEFVLMVE